MLQKCDCSNKVIIIMRSNQELEDEAKIKGIILELNKAGLSYLKFNEFAQAIEYFKKAEKIIAEELAISSSDKRVNQLAAVTYNNIACYYKKTKKPKVALKYLQKSLQIEIYKLNDWISIGSTHLNICAIYSYLKKHNEALGHVELALQLLQKQHLSLSDSSEEGEAFWNIKMLCLYNKAIEEEHLKQFGQSLASYKQTKQIARKYGAKNVGIIFSCDQAINRLEADSATRKNRMLSLFLRRRENEEQGHYDFMRRNINKAKKSKINPRDFSTAQLVKQGRPIRLERIATTSNKQSLAHLYKGKNQSINSRREYYKSRTEQTEPAHS